MFDKSKYIRGVSHPGKKVDLIREAGFAWVRQDCPFPFEDSWGNLREDYKGYKQRCSDFAAQGIHVMGITPYPRSFNHFGINPKTAEGLAQAEKVCAFLAEDLKDVVPGWQVTNEMNIFFFRAPLTLEEASDFILAGLKGIRSGNPQAISGCNIASFNDEARVLLQPLLEYKHLMDYMGLDAYYGTWANGEPDSYMQEIDNLYEFSGVPVLLQEFGFASAGGVLQPGDLDKEVQKYGYSNFADAKAHVEEFLEKIPAKMAQMVKCSPRNEWADNLISIEPHLLKKWPGCSEKYPHTPQGQTDFYDELMGKLIRHPHVIGTIIFKWTDDEKCWFCWQEDCPCETAWGMTDKNENPKPVYYVVKRYFTGK